jgi:DNA-binding NarL/FixJ family response regulator
MMRLRVLLADDHRLVCECLALLLSREPDVEVVGQVTESDEVLRAVRALDPDVLVLDIDLPGKTGLEIARALRDEEARAAVLLLSRHCDAAHVEEALKAKVAGYVVKGAAARDLLDAIRAAGAGHAYFSPIVARLVAGTLSRTTPRLSPREHEVLRLVALGRSTKEIAAELSIATVTVATFRKQLMSKLGLHNAAGLVRYAISHSLVSPPE